MVSNVAVQWGYAVALLLTAALTLGVGYWAYTTTGRQGGRTFFELSIAMAAWSAAAGVGVAISTPLAGAVSKLVQTLVALVIVPLWIRFAMAFSNCPAARRRRATRTATALAAVAAGFVVTNPLHGLYWEAFTVVETPFVYVDAPHGPAGSATIALVFVAIGAGCYYLGELFVTSRHRSSKSVLLLLLGTLVGSVPVAASEFGMVPADAFNHSPFGISVFTVMVGYAAFRLGMFDIAPVARDVLIDRIDDAFVVLDADGRVVDYNAETERLVPELSSDDAIGRDIGTVFPELAETLTLPPDEETDYRLSLAVDGRTEHYSVSVSTVTEQDLPVAYAVALHDVTEAVATRQRLERQNERLDKFASVVSHDLRNPLQVAFGHSGLLTDELSGDLQESAAAVEQSLDRMDDIITDLRTLAKDSQPVEETEPVSFESVVQQAWSTVETDGVRLDIDATGTIECDRSRLLTVLENLFANSVEHAGPDVTVTTGLTHDGFYVEDDGPGIPPEHSEQVFEYGETTREGGTGFGLAIVRTMVDSHGWAIAVDDDCDRGARFVVTGANTRRAGPAAVDDGESG